jgi:hypothetical protein
VGDRVERGANMHIQRRYLAGVFVAAIAAVAIFGLVRTTAGPAASGTPTSAVGAAPVPVPVNNDLKQTGTARLDLIGSTDGRNFYRAVKSDGRQCLGAGSASLVGDVGFLYCSQGDLLTDTNPVIVVPDVEASINSPNSWTLLRVDGFAAASVASVRLTDSSGATVAKTDVKNDLFSLKPNAPIGSGELIAYDVAGRIVATRPFTPSRG